MPTVRDTFARAGIRQGDILVAIDGNEVRDASAIRLFISQVAPGTRVPVRILRDGKAFTVNVTMGDLAKAEVAEAQYTVKDNRFLGGATFTELSPAVRESLGIASTVRGVVVSGVQAGSAAQSMGLGPGDVILDLNGVKTPGLPEFKQALKKMEGRKASVTLFRQGMIMTLTLVR